MGVGNWAGREFGRSSLTRLLVILLFVLVATALVIGTLPGRFITDSAGRPLPSDFLAVWSAGHMALDGQAAQAYDPALLHNVQVEIAGRPFDGRYLWLYPPLNFAPAIALALLPYSFAYIAWACGTLLLYATCICRIIESPEKRLVIGLSPVVYAAALIAQNGLLTAALFGSALLLLEDRPVLSGLTFALLAFKPQFGLLVPIALLFGGYWRAALAASIGIAGWVLIAYLLDHSIFLAFLRSLSIARHDFLQLGLAQWRKLQSLYGVIRLLGGSDAIATALGLANVMVWSAAIAFVWASNTDKWLKSALLMVGAAAVTPYLYAYDLPLLSVVVAFLWRHRPFKAWESWAVILAYLLLAVPVLFRWPAGYAATLLLACVVIGRLVLDRPRVANGAVASGRFVHE